MDFETIRSANNDLIRAHLHYAILFDDMTNVCPVTLEDPATGDLTIPTTAQTVGVIEKKAGVNLIHSMDNNEIEGYGDAEPVRTIISKRSVAFEAEYLETNLTVLQQFWGTYFTEDAGNLAVSAQGGVTLTTPNLPDNIFYHAYLVTEDDINGNEIYAYYILPQVKLTKVENQTSKDSDAVSYKMTFQAFRNTVLGFSVLQGWCGPGWVQLVDQAGFVSVPTDLTVTGASSGSLAPAATDQLTATGNNSINYTPLVSWTSSSNTIATVSSSGEVTAVAAGTATITATYLNSAGTSITGTFSVTVS